MMKSKVIALLGGRCRSCGETDIRVLQVNHKDGGGRAETQKGGINDMNGFYRRIVSGKRKTDDLDVRCANCNLLYEYVRGNKTLPAGAVVHPGKYYEPFTFC